MKCPRDVRPQDFERLLEAVPSGFDLQRSERYLYWRDFTFLVTKKANAACGHKVGDLVLFSVPTKVNLR